MSTMGMIRRYESLSPFSWRSVYEIIKAKRSTEFRSTRFRSNVQFGERTTREISNDVRTLLGCRSKEKNWTISGNIWSTVSTRHDIRHGDWLVGDSTRKLGEIR